MNSLSMLWRAESRAPFRLRPAPCAHGFDVKFEDAAGLRGELRKAEPMSRHTSWRAGGVADRAYVAADLGDLRAFLAALPPDEPVYAVGLGSNLLVRDGGVRGTVIFTHGVLRHTSLEGGLLHAGAGVPSPKVARFAAMHGLAGAEFLAGIPGTVGGALAMNAGCFGGETWNIVERVTTLDRTGRLHERARAEYDVGYRTVILKADRHSAFSVQHSASGDPAAASGGGSIHPSAEWFVGASFSLLPGDSATSRAMIKQLLERRIATQPLNQPNAGSVFRNPQGDYAARLIEACGLKGFALGGAVISEKHANFIVNAGNARAADIEALIEIAHAAVRRKFGVDLEREVRIIGEPA